jgi:alginate O-acetyltransferase complex protein AlgI
LFERGSMQVDPWCGKYPYGLVIAKMSLMFILTNIGWVIFRSNSVDQIIYFLTQGGLGWSADTAEFLNTLLFFSMPLILVQVYQYFSRDLLILTKLTTGLRVPIYGFLALWICIFGVRESSSFIYFQF